jgi:hypothetical protein
VPGKKRIRRVHAVKIVHFHYVRWVPLVELKPSDQGHLGRHRVRRAAEVKTPRPRIPPVDEKQVRVIVQIRGQPVYDVRQLANIERALSALGNLVEPAKVWFGIKPLQGFHPSLRLVHPPAVPRKVLPPFRIGKFPVLVHFLL